MKTQFYVMLVVALLLLVQIVVLCHSWHRDKQQPADVYIQLENVR